MGPITRWLPDGAPWSWLLVGSAGVCALTIFGALLFAWRSREERPGRATAFAWAPIVSLLSMIAFGGLAIAQARRHALGLFERRGAVHDAAAMAAGLAQSVDVQLNGAGTTAALAFLLLPFVALAALLPTMPRPRSDPAHWAPRLLLGGALVAPTALALLGVVRYVGDALAGFAAVADVAPARQSALFAGALRDAMTRTNGMRVLVLAFAVPCGIAAVAASWMGTRRQRSIGLTGPIAVFLFGLVAFGAPRPQAHDARHPPPPAPPALVPTVRNLPRTGACPTVERGSVLTVLGEGATVDGNAIDATSLVEYLNVQRRNWTILEPDRPRPARILVVADAATPMSRVLPWLGRAARAGYGEPTLVTVRPGFLRTRTVGRIDRSRACGFWFRLDPAGEPASRFATWGDLATALERAGAPLTIAP